METVRRSQGKITTQNEKLLAMLREKTMEKKQVSRVYVDSPIFSDEDENKYKFISTDPEDFDYQPTERYPQSHKNPIDPSRYEDMNSRGSKRGLQHPQEYDTEYIVRSANATRNYGSPVKALTPIKTVSQRDEESQDEEELRQEEEYQRALQQKIRHQQEENKNIHIPKLALDKSDDGDDRGVADSLDYTVPEEQPAYNDSLEEEEETEEEEYTQKDKERVSRIMKDSLDESAYEEPKKKPFTRFAPNTNDNQDSNRGRIQTPHNSNRGREKLDQMFQQHRDEDPQYSQDPRYNQDVEQSNREYQPPPAQPQPQQYQAPPQQYQAPPQQYQPPPQQYQAPPQQYQVPPQQYQAPPQQYQAPQQQYQAPPQQYQAPPQQFQAPPQQYQALPQQYQAPPQQYQPPPQQFQQPLQYQPPPISDQFGEYPQGQYDNSYDANGYDEGQGQGYNAYPNQQQEDYSQYEQNQNSDEYYESDQASQDQLQMSPGRQRKQVDYLSLNKEQLRGGKKQQSYGNILKNKKEIKENLPFIDVSHRVGKNKPPLPNKKTPQPAVQKPLGDPNRNMSGPPPAGPPPVAPASAESVWEKRAQTLAAKKSGGKKPKKPLQKYPSESRVDTVHNQGQSSPMQPQHSMSEPIRSEVMIDPNRQGNKPVTHTVFTDDGQKVSVDINLKVLSPPALKPLAPGGGIRPIGGVQQQPLLQQQRPTQPSPRQQAPQGLYRPTMQKQQQFYEDFQPKAQYRPAMQPPLRPMPQQHMIEDPQYLEQRNQAMEGEYRMLEQQYRGLPPQQPQQNYHQMPSSQQQQQLQQQQLMQLQQQQQFQQQFQMHQAPQMPAMGHGMAHQVHTEPDYNHPPREGWASPHSGADVNPEAPGSPYKVLPPIGSADTDQGRNPPYGEYDTSPTKDDQGSYAAAFKNKKTKKPPEYKTYTLGDYRKMKKEVKLGGLGPDLDSETHKEKKEKIMKQQEYAKMISQRNREAKASKKPKEREEPTSADLLTKRKIALEYAKNVPKPKVQEKSSSASVTHGSQPALSVYQGSPRSVSENSGQVSNREQDAEIINLQILQQRHEQERQQAALIRQNISGVSGTA